MKVKEDGFPDAVLGMSLGYLIDCGKSDVFIIAKVESMLRTIRSAMADPSIPKRMAALHTDIKGRSRQ